MHTPDHVVERLRDWRSRFVGTPLGWALTFVLAAVGVYFFAERRDGETGHRSSGLDRVADNPA